jgi:hypothetical protein
MRRSRIVAKYNVGDIHENNKGEKYEIIDIDTVKLKSGANASKFKIRFTHNGFEKVVSRGHLAGGKITSDGYGKPKRYRVGDIYTNNNGDKYQILEEIKREQKNKTVTRFRVNFIDYGTEKEVELKQLTAGVISPSAKFKVGEIFDTENYGQVEIVKKEKDASYLVKFLRTGNTKVVKGGRLANGLIRDNEYAGISVGDIFDTISGKVEVIKCTAAERGGIQNYHIRFCDSGNISKAIKKLDLVSGLVIDLNVREKYFLGRAKNQILPQQQILFRFEYDIITEIIDRRGEAFVTGAMQTYFKDEGITFEYIDTLKFDTFKAFYKYLITMDTIIKGETR